MNTAKPDQDIMLDELLAFRAGFRSLNLATADSAGEPEASYAPFILDQDGSFCVYISELSRHTANLLQNPRASVLFIEDEQGAQQLFARQRLTYSCRAERVERGSQRWQQLMETFAEQHGKLVDMLRGMQDFHLFRLVPEHGNYVRGFAQAYALEGEDLNRIRHRNDEGHRSG